MKPVILILVAGVLSAGTVIGYLELRRPAQPFTATEPVAPSLQHADRAALMELVSKIDELKSDLKVPLDASGVQHFKTMAGYAEADFQRWIQKCPAKEPLLNPLEGAVYELKNSHESMTFAYTASHPVSSPQEVANEVLTKLHNQFNQVRELAMVSMNTAKP